MRATASGGHGVWGVLPVAKFLPGLELEGDLLPGQHLSPLADVVRVVRARAVHVGDGVCAAAVRQRHPVERSREKQIDVFTHLYPNGSTLNFPMQSWPDTGTLS